MHGVDEAQIDQILDFVDHVQTVAARIKLNRNVWMQQRFFQKKTEWLFGIGMESFGNIEAGQRRGPDLLHQHRHYGRRQSTGAAYFNDLLRLEPIEQRRHEHDVVLVNGIHLRLPARVEPSRLKFELMGSICWNFLLRYYTTHAFILIWTSEKRAKDRRDKK